VSEDAVNGLSDQPDTQIAGTENDRQTIVERDARQRRPLAVVAEAAVAELQRFPVRLEWRLIGVEGRIELAAIFAKGGLQFRAGRVGKVLGPAGGIDDERPAAVHELLKLLSLRIGQLDRRRPRQVRDAVPGERSFAQRNRLHIKVEL